MARYWLGPWEWRTEPFPHWAQPALAVAALDLRSIQQCAGTVTPSGLSLFITPDAANLGSSYENLGTNPLANWNQQAKNRWRSALVLPNALTANNLRQAVWETLTLQSDPIGDDRCLPLVPTTKRRFEVWLAGQLADSKQFDLSGFESPPMLDLLKRIYRRMRQACLDGQMPSTHYRKWLGFQVRKFGIDYRNFRPADVPDEEPLAPETTITESFNTADSTTLGPDLSWTEIDGNLGVRSNQFEGLNGGQNVARADSDLSSDDHYAQFTVSTKAAWTQNCSIGPVARKDSSATLTYYLVHFDSTSGTDTSSTYKRVSGSFTLLNQTSVEFAATDTAKLECDGSSIARSRNGSNQNSTTDTTITGNVRCGVSGFYNVTGDAGQLRGDNFEAADLAAPPAGNRRRRLICGAAA